MTLGSGDLGTKEVVNREVVTSGSGDIGKW